MASTLLRELRMPIVTTLHTVLSAPNPAHYGAADTSVAMATGSIEQLLDWLDRHGSAA